MSEQLNTFTNPLNGKQGLVKHDALHGTDNIDPGSLLLDVSQCIEAVSVLEKNSRMQIFTRFEDMDIDPDTATLDEVFRNMPNETILVLEAYEGYFPNMNIIPVILGEKQSGTLIITAGFSAGARFSLEFHSTKGVWHRRFNRYNNSSTAYRDSGWVRVETHGLQFEIESSHVTYLNSSLSNLTTPGEYAVNGTNMALFSDNPYTTAGVYTRLSFITVKRLFVNGGVLQEVRSALGYPVQMSRVVNTDGTVSTWNIHALSGMAFNSSSTMGFAGGTLTGTLATRTINPSAANTYSNGTAALYWSNIYSQNAVTVVSDSAKKPIQEGLTQEEVSCAKQCAKLYKKYKLAAAIEEKGEESARYHIGVIAQDIIKTFTDSGLDWRKYGIVTFEEWDAVEALEYRPETYDDSGNLLTESVQPTEGRDAGSIYMVRYDELNCFINAGILASYEDLESRIKELETR